MLQPVYEPAVQWVNNKKGSVQTEPQSVKKHIFDRLTEGKGAGETNKSNLSAYIGTVRFDLCSKPKHLAKQAFVVYERFLHL